MPQISVVVPTLSNPESLARVLDGYERQTLAVEGFEVIVVSDCADPDPSATDAAIGTRPFTVRRLVGKTPGASANRNVGWRQARAPIVLFTDDDTVPDPRLLSEHVDWHRRFSGPEVAVLGHVRWAPGLKVTPFMRWLEFGIQFDFTSIQGTEASWAHLYSANCSLKRPLLEQLGGYDELRFPYGYEDLDLGRRAQSLGLRVLYDRAAVVEHWRAMTVELWQARAPRLAMSEWRFHQRHPEVEPWFFGLLSDAASRPAQRGRATRMAAVVPRWIPGLGPLVWNLADLYWRQQIAPPFLAAWAAAASGAQPALEPSAAAVGERTARA